MMNAPALPLSNKDLSNKAKLPSENSLTSADTTSSNSNADAGDQILQLIESFKQLKEEFEAAETKRKADAEAFLFLSDELKRKEAAEAEAAERKADAEAESMRKEAAEAESMRKEAAEAELMEWLYERSSTERDDDGGDDDGGDDVDVDDVFFSNINCSSDVFKPIIDYAKSYPLIKNNVEEANILYNNGKFYYSSGEMVGALVSYSCATVLLNSILRFITINIKPTREDPSGNNIIKIKNAIKNYNKDTKKVITLDDGKTIAKEVDKVSANSSQFVNLVNTIIIGQTINELINSLLNVIQNLQKSVGSSKSTNDNDETKDWEKICTKIKPLVFKKGGADCIFYSDVAGLIKEKKLIDSSLVYPLVYPNLYPKTSKGILIYGPPGTGKTYLVKAAVNELQKKDDSVGVLFFSPSPGDLKGKYVGETEKRIEEAFRCASDAACKYQNDCPGKKKYISIIFMDEMDAIAPDRDKDTTGLAVNSVNTLLQMMDGIKSFPNVAVVAATNYPWNLDGAILRRFDTQILINIPSELDLKELLNMSMNRFINLEADKSSFNYCDSKGKKSDSENDEQLNCNLECEQNPIIERYRTFPYSQYNIEYFNNIEDGGLVDSIIYQIAKDKFSNSDLDRLIKAAATNAGELAVDQSLFYSPRLIGDFKHDNKYISALTGFKFLEKSARSDGSRKIDHHKIADISIDVLKSFVSNTPNSNVIQLNPPDFVRIIYGDHYYYNTKSLLYKNNDSIIQHPTIKDIYIKGNKVMSAGGIDMNFDAETYMNNILGRVKKELLKEGAESFVGQVQFEPEDYEMSYGKEHEFEDIDMIIAFDFTFKENSNFSTEKTLLPVYRDLLDYVFGPIYDTFQDIKQNIELDKQIRSNQTDISGNQLKRKYTISVNGKKGGAIQDLDGLNETDLTKYMDEKMFVVNKDEGKPVLKFGVAAFHILTDDDFRENMTVNLSKKFSVSSIKEHNLDFYNHLLLYTILPKEDPNINEESINKEMAIALSEYKKRTENDEFYKKYVKLHNELLDRKKAEFIKNNLMDISGSSVDLYLSLINYTGKINFVEGSTDAEDKNFYSNIKTYRLLDGTSVPMFYYKRSTDDIYGVFRITVAQYKRFIKNFNVYNNIFLIYTAHEDKFIDIDEDLFEIMFKDVFSDIKITSTEDDLEKIWHTTGTSLNAAVMQLYVNDIIKMYNLYLSFLDVDIKNNIRIINASVQNKKNNLDIILYGYIKSVFIIDLFQIIDLSLQVINDNYNVQNGDITFLGGQLDLSGGDVIGSSGDTFDPSGVTFFDLKKKPKSKEELGNLLTTFPVTDEQINKVLEMSGGANTVQKIIDMDESNTLTRVDSILKAYLNTINGNTDGSFNWGTIQGPQQPLSNEDDENKSEDVNKDATKPISKEDEEKILKRFKNRTFSEEYIKGLLEEVKNGTRSLKDLEKMLEQNNKIADDVAAALLQKKKEEASEYARKTVLANMSQKDREEWSTVYKGGSKSQTFKNKRIKKKSKSAFLKKKSKTFKNKKQHTHHNIKMEIFNKKGGAPPTPEDKRVAFIKWCVINKEKTGNADLAENGLGSIAKKTIFVKTQFKYDELQKQRKQGIANDIIAGGASLIDSIKNIFRSKKDQKSAEAKYNEIIEELIKKNQMLPLVFNNIDAIGFLDDGTPNNIVDDQLIMNKSIDINIKWISIAGNGWKKYFTSLPSLVSVIKASFGVHESGGATNYIGSGLVAVGIWAGTVTGIPAIIGVSLLVISNIYAVCMQNPDKKANEIINDVGSMVLFSLLTELRYMECNNLNTTNVFKEISKQIEKIASTLTKQKNMKNWTNTDTTKDDIIKKYNIGNNIITRDIKNMLVNLNIPMRSFYYALNIVKSTYNKETGPMLLEYFENRDKFMETLKKREEKKK